ncbi:Rossmann-like and DUF2520 domain-containing protein [Gulbenkiania mobilis]|uniref:Short-subunit dehydrogenase-like oxidoreductase (DUF2520 family) n=1 Tax=Gulbenkiania mobilis TaxID=397457 RepID=A0ABY2CXI9_GULMO|nr:putative short-subunit dehydrogenase-like oxidoreductase (DUF2520 family) [Gulbenkiania mobilis]
MSTLAIVGGGRLGQTFGRLAHVAGWQVEAVVNRDADHARAAADFCSARQALTDVAALPAVSLLLLAVPDTAIADVAARLAEAGGVASGTVVFHASGALDATVLGALKCRTPHLASLHPAYAFADPVQASAHFAGTLCALEGEAMACTTLEGFCRDLGGVPFALAPGSKAAYHAALSVASNFLVTLRYWATALAGRAGVQPGLAEALVGTLMRQTLANTDALGTAAALTGPIVRGDASTVSRHLEVLQGDEAAAYRALGALTVDLAGARLDGATRTALLEALYPRKSGPY